MVGRGVVYFTLIRVYGIIGICFVSCVPAWVLWLLDADSVLGRLYRFLIYRVYVCVLKS